MFCSKCGANNKETAKFCVKCGTPVNAAPAAPVYEQRTHDPRQSPAYMPPAPATHSAPAGYGHRTPINMDKTKLIKIAAAAAALIVLILAIVFISKGCSGGSGSSRAADVPKQAIDALVDGSGRKMKNLLPPPVIDPDTTSYVMFSHSNPEQVLSGMLSPISEDIRDEYGGRPKYTVTITSQYNYGSSDIKAYERQNSHIYSSVNIQAVTEMEVELNINRGEEYEYLDMTAIQIDGKWYLDMTSFSNLINYCPF